MAAVAGTETGALRVERIAKKPAVPNAASASATPPASCAREGRPAAGAFARECSVQRDGAIEACDEAAAEITAGLGARAHRTFGGRLAPDAAVDPQVLQTHRIGDFRDWQAIVEYAYRISRELERIQFPPADRALDRSPRRSPAPDEGSG